MEITSTTRRTIFLAISFLGFASQATMTLLTYPTYFYKTPDATDPNNIKIFAGRTVNSTCTTDDVSPCDSCIKITDVRNSCASSFSTTNVCNTKEIYPSLKFTVKIKSDNSALFSSSNSVFVVNSNSQSVITHELAGTFAVNNELTVTFTWAGICNSLSTGGSSTCSSSFAPNKIQVGIGTSATALTESVAFTIAYRYVSGSGPQTYDCNNASAFEGFCEWGVYPGDKKVYVFANYIVTNTLKVENLSTSTSSGTADDSTMTYNGIRVYHKDTSDYKQVLPSNGTYTDLEFDGTNFKSNKVGDLTNGVQYSFLLANVDQAGNTTHFSDPCDTHLCLNGDASNPQCLTPDLYGSTQTAVPVQVNGLLDNQSCFIATAAFGTGIRVDTFRKFRDEVLLKHRLGHRFVVWYYQNSPRFAQLIVDHPVLKGIAQLALWPVFVLTLLFLKLGFLPLSLPLLVALASLGLGYWFWRAKV
jgi:hypothetical protein